MIGGLIFALAGVVLIAAFAGLIASRRRAEDAAAAEDRLSDEEFRRIEFGDDGP